MRMMVGAVLLALVSLAGQAPAAERPRLWFLGLALYDESWSQNDVTEAAAAFGRQVDGYQVGTRVVGGDARAVAQSFALLARRAGPRDLVVVYASTHGGPGALAVRSAGRDQPPIEPAALRRWLAALGTRPTIVILSACYSGSFLPALEAANRIVLTAAREDRTSFGCQAGARHTVFGAALLDALQTAHESWRQIVERVRADVTAAEAQLQVELPSEPQVAVGEAVAALFDAPDF